MSEALTIRETGAMTAPEMRAQVNLIQEVMKAVMKNGTHFGKVPGCGDKPTLLKPGAEKILSTFKIAVIPEVEDLSGPDEARYRVTARGIAMGSGVCVGCGIGECSSNEEKYKWRAAVCDEEFDATPEDRRRVKFAKGPGGKAYTKRQVRTEHADIANTVLKIAKKRAQVDLCLTATAASDVFTQDIEDLPAEVAAEMNEGYRPPVAMPTPKPQQPPATEPPAKQHDAQAGADAPPQNNDAAVSGVIEQVVEAETKTGKPYWKIVIAGAYYTTFDTALVEIATREHEAGNAVRLYYITKGQYKNAVRIEVEQ